MAPGVLAREQRGVARHSFAAAAVTALVLWLAWGAGDAWMARTDDLAARLALALRLDLAVLLCLGVAIGRVATQRFLSAEDIGGGASPYLPTADPHEFIPGEGGLRLVARRGAAVSGRLVDAEGRPVAAGWVAADGGEAFPCAADGSFRIGGLRAGRVRLAAWVGAGVVDLGVVEAPGADLAVRVPATPR